MRSSRALLLMLMLLSGAVQAANYNFNLLGTSAPCTGTWDQNGSTFTCSGRVNLASGDSLSVNSVFLGDIVVVATGGFTLVNNTIGSSSRNISLETGFSTISATGTNNIFGSVTGGSASVSLATGTITGSLRTSSGAITLNGTTVNGSLTSSGANNLTNATIGGAAQITSTLVSSGTRFNSTLSVSNDAQFTGGTVVGAAQIGGALSATGTTFSSNVTGSSSATFNGGSIAGFLNAAGNVVTTNGTTIGGALTTNFGTVNLGGGSVGGRITSPNGVTTNNTNVSGDIAASNGSVSLTGGTIVGNVSSGCCQITLTSVTLNGNVSATSNNIVASGSSITGNLTSTNTVSLANTSVTGDVTAATWGVTITGTGTSKVIGTCTPSLTSPVDLCQAVVTPTCVTDNFNRTSLGTSDWTVTNRNGSFGDPRIVGNRLRLTDNSGNVATAATFQRLLPATSNYVQVQFKYYAYNGNGADGVAVIFSNASTTPQPGGYGGSLGYAQLNGTSGFAGGWLGVALDEYGNFSNPTETRNGGPGFRPDSVSIRGSGSGTSGYAYLDGTAANLNPGIDVSGSTAGPGHTYRITLDSTVSGRTMVTVERNTGSGFTTLVPAFDALAKSGQAQLPSNFFMSLTGSTGGSNNIHELDDFQICATRMNPIGQQIDHFELSYSGTALTCNPQPVTIRACLNSSCSSLFTDPVTVTLTPSSYWSAIAPATGGGNTITFSGGTAQARLSVATAGTVVVGVTGSDPVAKAYGTTVCSTSGCRITYADSGLLLQVPNMLAAKPTAATLSAVRKADDALQCVPAFANVTRSVKFTSAYSNPTTGTQPVVVNGIDVRGTPVPVDLNFDATGTAPLTVRYNDAGQMKLTARYEGSGGTADDGLLLEQRTVDGLFVSRPYGLCLETASTCSGANASCAVFPGGIRAGDSFPLNVRAVGWESDGEALTAAQLCSGNITTPNFQLAGIALASSLRAPTGGATGSMTPDSYSHALGNQTAVTTSISEVGVFAIIATPSTSYLGQAVSGGTSGLVGRFIPAYLGVTGSARLRPSCGNAFSYQGQAMEVASNRQPTLTITGRNRAGGITTNYDRSAPSQGDFWKLSAPAAGSYSSVTGAAARDARLLRQGTVSQSVTGANDGDGARTYSWTGEQWLYQLASVPSSDDYPFRAKLRQSFAASLLTDADGACYGTGSGCMAFSYDFEDDANNNLGSEVRLGRLRIGNAHGSELQSLTLPLAIESWRDVAGGSFQPEGLDTCTNLGTPALDTYTGNLSLGETTATPGALTGGEGSLVLSAPGIGNDGSVQVSFPNSPAWLQYPWDGANRQLARGLASFGIYRGAAPLIFRRELYR